MLMLLQSGLALLMQDGIRLRAVLSADRVAGWDEMKQAANASLSSHFV